MSEAFTRNFFTKDHPEIGGRRPKPGEHAYQLRFPLADGSELVLHCGDETLGRFRELLGSMDLDDALETSA